MSLSDPFSILLCENMTRWQTKSDHHFVIYIFPPPLFINRNDSSYRELHGWLSTTILMRRRRVVSVFNRISIHPGVERDESDQRRGLITITTACVYTWILSSEEEAVDSSYFFVLRPSPPNRWIISICSWLIHKKGNVSVHSFPNCCN